MTTMIERTARFVAPSTTRVGRASRCVVATLDLVHTSRKVTDAIDATTTDGSRPTFNDNKRGAMQLRDCYRFHSRTARARFFG